MLRLELEIAITQIGDKRGWGLIASDGYYGLPAGIIGHIILVICWSGHSNVSLLVDILW